MIPDKTKYTTPLRRGFLCLLLALTGCSTAQLHTTSNVLLVADWAQTRYISTHPQQYQEMNPTLDDHPSIGAVNVHFIGALALNNAVYYLLPENKRRNWSLMMVGIEGVCVGNNARIGVKFNW